jgi:hypothetical protein
MLYKWSESVTEQVHHQISFAYDLGLYIPDFLALETKDEFEKAYLNPDVVVNKNIAFQRQLGTKLGIAAYFNGEKFINFVGVTKDAFMFSGSQGLELPKNILMIHQIDNKIAKNFFKKAAKTINEREPEYRGFLQVYFIVDVNGVYWYESIVFGAEPDFIAAYKAMTQIDDISTQMKIPKRYGASVRIFPIGYPDCGKVSSEDVEFLKDVWDIEYIGTEGVFFCYNSDSNIKDTWRKLYHKCAGIEGFHYLYRIDGETISKQRFHEIKKAELT